ncbi:unnamed protein product [Linum trigynum]|uniref:cytokinin dehydrogenase n=1 Tax=Linum trigynum TaxID=586398 RepID=A0AAV2EZ20_9ROSI
MAKTTLLLAVSFLATMLTLSSSQVAPLSLTTTTCPLPPELSPVLLTDQTSKLIASTDYGNMVHVQPAAVANPRSVDDISLLIKSSYSCCDPYGVAARGNGHCTKGQAMVRNGVVLNMRSLSNNVGNAGSSNNVVVSPDRTFADVSGGALWIEVLNETLKLGVAPVTWTDLLYLTVGGALSNAGIGGQTFRFGPQIANVHELDVVTGKGEIVTCSANKSSELFYAVLGGLGQFGVITRARIALAPAPQRVKWMRLLYSDFTTFSNDQEKIIANYSQPDSVDYIEGQVLLDNGTPNLWETSFFPTEVVPTITSLVKEKGVVYALEVAIYYNSTNEEIKDQQMKQLIRQLKNERGLAAMKDVTYYKFLDRIPVPDPSIPHSHPWLNLFVPKSGVSKFNDGVVRDIIMRTNITVGPVLFYPMNRNKWDDKMSVVIPDEEIFYAFSLLSQSNVDDWPKYLDQNAAVLAHCEEAGIEVKQYLAGHSTQQDWIKHFGPKWAGFQQMKAQFDPKFILSPGQKIFN